MELAEPQGPFGARGVAEMPLVPFLPAVASAIHDATGVWITELPATPEKILEALHGPAGGAGERGAAA
jgi:CO/xanthine dehydrogenase Mo-binding subunit